MNWLESILYSFITAAAEFLPVSSQAHRTVLLNLFGGEGQPYLLQMLIHIAGLAALIVSCRESLGRINQTKKILSIPARRRKRQPDMQTVYLLRFLRTAAVPTLLGLTLTLVCSHWDGKLQILSLLLILNGIVLYVPSHMPIGNKDSRYISGLESLLIGIFNGLGSVSGFSKLGFGVSAAIARGADPLHALNWNLLLMIPAVVVLIGIDLFLIVTNGISGFGFMMLLQSVVSALFAYWGAYFAIMLLRFMAVKMGFSAFAYYSWGAAMFAFILYMI